MFLPHPNSAPSHPSHHEHLDLAQGTDTQTLVQSQPHAMATECISKKSIPEECCFHQNQRCCFQSFLLTDQAAAGPGIYLVYLWKARNNVCSFTGGCYLHTAGFYRLQETITERQQVKQQLWKCTNQSSCCVLFMVKEPSSPLNVLLQNSDGDQFQEIGAAITPQALRWNRQVSVCVQSPGGKHCWLVAWVIKKATSVWFSLTVQGVFRTPQKLEQRKAARLVVHREFPSSGSCSSHKIAKSACQRCS